MNDFDLILEKIEEYSTITIFRHVRADGDAAGSQLGLKEWIKDNYPAKKVYALGEDVYDRYPIVDRVNDEEIKSSLAIILDTSSKDRVDDQRFEMAKETIKIDHHPSTDDFADHNFVKESAAATCEYLTFILDSFEKKLSEHAARYLYSGILTDSLNFTTASVTADTIKAAYILAKTGIPINEIVEKLFDKDANIFDFCTYMRSKITYNNGLAYVILDDDDYKRFNIDDSRARFQIAELSGVKNYKIWCVFTKNKDGYYDGSLRSKKGYTVNETAAKYGGGGHANASGVKGLDLEAISRILNDLRKEIKKHM